MSVRVGLKKYVPSTIDWHHEDCRVTHGDREGQNFLSHPHTNNEFFSCSPLKPYFLKLEKLEKVSKKS